MFIRFLKKMVIILALMFAIQSCALYVEDDDGFYHHHRHFHHRDWEHEHSSLQQYQVAENGKSIQTGQLSGVAK